MLEFIEVPHGTIFPFSCVACTGTAGPLVDTHREDVNGNRVYLCRSCTRRAAIVLGLVDAEDLDALDAALEKLSAVERDLASMSRARDGLQLESDGRGRRIDELVAQDEQHRGRIAQLEERLAERAQQDLALVAPTSAGELD